MMNRQQRDMQKSNKFSSDWSEHIEAQLRGLDGLDSKLDDVRKETTTHIDSFGTKLLSLMQAQEVNWGTSVQGMTDKQKGFNRLCSSPSSTIISHTAVKTATITQPLTDQALAGYSQPWWWLYVVNWIITGGNIFFPATQEHRPVCKWNLMSTTTRTLEL